MDRREWLKKAAIIAAGVVAVDQLELLDRLAPRRLYFRGHDFTQPYGRDWKPGDGFMITREMLEDDIYGPIVDEIMKRKPFQTEFMKQYDFMTDSYKVVLKPRKVGRSFSIS